MCPRILPSPWTVFFTTLISAPKKGTSEGRSFAIRYTADRASKTGPPPFFVELVDLTLELCWPELPKIQKNHCKKSRKNFKIKNLIYSWHPILNLVRGTPWHMGSKYRYCGSKLIFEIIWGSNFWKWIFLGHFNVRNWIFWFSQNWPKY